MVIRTLAKQGWLSHSLCCLDDSICSKTKDIYF